MVHVLEPWLVIAMMTPPAEPTDCAPLPGAMEKERPAVWQRSLAVDPPDPLPEFLDWEEPPVEADLAGSAVAVEFAEEPSSAGDAEAESVLPGLAVTEGLEAPSVAEALSLLDPPLQAVRTMLALSAATARETICGRRMGYLTWGMAG